VQGLWLMEYNLSSQRSEGEHQPDIADPPTIAFATWSVQRQHELIGM
jgi:hypothetical protein